MKLLYLFSLVFLLVHSNYLFSQTPAPGSNILRPELDKYVGSWICTNGVDEIVIQLKKVNYLFQNSQYAEDIIMGCHKYIKNGSLVENCLPDFPFIGQSKKGSIFIYIEPLAPNINKLTGTLVDSLKHKNQELNIEYRLNNKIEELVWNLTSPGDLLLPPAESGITLPSDLIFRRL